MVFFILEYRVKGYLPSDAYRLDPKWGKRTFTISSKDLGTDDIEVVRALAAAREVTPEGYELFSVLERDALTTANQHTS